MKRAKIFMISIILMLNTVYFPCNTAAEDCDWPMPSRDSLGSYTVPPSCTPPYKYFNKDWEWTSEIYLNNNRSVIASNGKIFCAGFSGLFCVEEITGKLLWSKDKWHSLCLCKDEKLFTLKSDNSKDLDVLVCLDVKTGEVVWSTNASSGLAFSPTESMTYDNLLFLMESNADNNPKNNAYQVKCINIMNGSAFWKTNLDYNYSDYNTVPRFIGIHNNLLWCIVLGKICAINTLSGDLYNFNQPSRIRVVKIAFDGLFYVYTEQSILQRWKLENNIFSVINSYNLADLIKNDNYEGLFGFYVYSSEIFISLNVNYKPYMIKFDSNLDLKWKICADNTSNFNEYVTSSICIIDNYKIYCLFDRYIHSSNDYPDPPHRIDFWTPKCYQINIFDKINGELIQSLQAQSGEGNNIHDIIVFNKKFIVAGSISLVSYSNIEGDVNSKETKILPPVIDRSRFLSTDTKKIKRFDEINIEGCNNSVAPGLPVIPQKTLKILLPPGKDLLGIEVLSQEERELNGEYEIIHGQESSIAVPGTEYKYTPPDDSVYKSNAYYPYQMYGKPFIQKYRGAKIAYLPLFPIKYNPITKKVLYYPNPIIKYTLSDGTSNPVTLSNNLYQLLKEQNFDNPEVIEQFKPVQQLQTYNNTLSENNQMLIISNQYLIGKNDGLMNDFADYAAWKTSIGVPTLCYPIEQIIASTSYGRDTQEKIRYFLKRFIKGNLNYVLIGGSHRVIPTREINLEFNWRISKTYKKYGLFVSDLYYSCLDGDYELEQFNKYDWDSNANGKFGEINDVVPDLEPDIALGRAPINNLEELKIFIDKNVDYYNNQHKLKKGILLTAQRLDEYTWGQDAEESLVKDKIIPQDYDINRLYDREKDYNSADVAKAINNNIPNIVTYSDHGYCSGWQNFTTDDIPKLANKRKYFICFSNACLTNEFGPEGSCDYCSSDPCFGEKMITFENGGAFIFIGNTHFGTYNPGDPTTGDGFMREKAFLRSLLINKVNKIGDAFRQSQINMLGYYGDSSSTTYCRWVHYVYNMLGDPTAEYEPSNEKLMLPTNLEQWNINETVIPHEGTPSANEIIFKGIAKNDGAYFELDLSWISNTDNIRKNKTYFSDICYANQDFKIKIFDLQPGYYKWRIRTVKTENNFSDWVSYGFSNFDFYIAENDSVPDRIVIIPGPVHIMTPGSTQKFTARIFNKAGNELDNSNIKWHADCGNIAPDGLYASPAVDGIVCNVYASVGYLQAKCEVNIKNSSSDIIDRIVIIPEEALVQVGKTFQFKALAYDKNNNIIKNISFEWSLSNSGVGSISRDGLFKANYIEYPTMVFASYKGSVGKAMVLVTK